MKPTPTIIFLLSVLILLTSARAIPAQTPANAENTGDAAHTLSEAQKQAIKRIRVESEKKAAPVALRLAGVVNKIYENMLADQPDEELRARLSREMKEAAWELLTIKGQSIRDTVNVLTPEQKQLLKSERLKPGAPADMGEVIAKTFKLPDK